jgi:hypothetical protein
MKTQREQPELMIVSARPLTLFDVLYWREEAPKHGTRLVVIRPAPPDPAKAASMMELAEAWRRNWE